MTLFQTTSQLALRTNFAMITSMKSAMKSFTGACMTQRTFSNMPKEAPSVGLFNTERSALQHSFGSYSPKDNENLPLMVTDLGVVQRQYKRWVRNLPTVRPFYAVKCNPATPVLEELAACGAGFDCASKVEIQAALDTGASPCDIIFANPVKAFDDVKFARKKGVKRMTFDNMDELEKVHALYPEAELVLRLLTDDSGSLMRFSSKFGASMEQANDLLTRSVELDMTVVGLSFHIGSGCFDPCTYDGAIEQARAVADLAASKGLPPFSLLDIGGGFPGNPTPDTVAADGVPSFETFAEVIAQAVAKHFPGESFPGLEVISEPGRYFATAASTLFTIVQGKRKEADAANPEKSRFLYYINDGVYGSFNSIMFDHAKPEPVPVDDFLYEPMRAQFAPEAGQRLQHIGSQGFSTKATPAMAPATIFGPTCDSIDKITTDFPIRELNLGEWLVFPDMGAYTAAAASTFNGVPLPIKTFVRSIMP